MSRRIVWVVSLEGDACWVFSTKAAAMKAARQYCKDDRFSRPTRQSARRSQGVAEHFFGYTEDGDRFDAAVTPHEVQS